MYTSRTGESIVRGGEKEMLDVACSVPDVIDHAAATVQVRVSETPTVVAYESWDASVDPERTVRLDSNSEQVMDSTEVTSVTPTELGFLRGLSSEHSPHPEVDRKAVIRVHVWLQDPALRQRSL